MIRKIFDSPTDPDDEGSDKVDGEDIEVINPLVDHPLSSSPTENPAINSTSIIPITPRNFQPVLSSLPSSVPTPSPKTST
ncbi:hypothetical protein O181_007504 [Austropuccinia psidii MF-1]|uniref:Uncharacterized protein n=1 Tax=Austropuccinia psidii MF-1 TaxID=1389203 RepID=A0A9Q3BL07_9BASI|nr:hypothetical protein [Austropuccinia psidii MF-1]